MEQNQLLSVVRRYLNDKSSLVWKDEELLRMIHTAVKCYSEDTGCFHGKFDFCPDANGFYSYPEDYICFQVGWNKEEHNVQAICSHELQRFYSDSLFVKGLPKFIFDDLDTNGQYRLCPNPIELQNIQIADSDYGDVIISDPEICGTIIKSEIWKQSSDYGIISDEYGITSPGYAFGTILTITEYEFDGNYGVIYNDEYGTEKEGAFYGVAISVIQYNFVGDAMYSRYAELFEISDYMALVYHVLYQSYNTDSDFSDPSRANVFLMKYRNRVSMFSQIRHKNKGKSLTGKFF